MDCGTPKIEKWYAAEMYSPLIPIKWKLNAKNFLTRRTKKMIIQTFLLTLHFRAEEERNYQAKNFK